MLRLFCRSKQQTTIDSLNLLTQNYTTHQWAYDKNEGYVLSFPSISLNGDLLHYAIQESLKEFVKVSIKYNPKIPHTDNGVRLIIESDKVSKEILDKAKFKLDEFYGFKYEYKYSPRN